MQASAYFTARNGCLVPADDDAVKAVHEVARRGKGVLVKLHVPRNPRHHRLYWALLNEVCEAGGWGGTPETLSTWLKVATGHVETMIGPKGQTIYIPKSISFGAMPQNEFGPFFDAAISAVCERLLSGANEQALKQRVYDAVDMGYSAMATGA